MKRYFLFVVALKQESIERFETLKQPLIYSGVGKINAALSLTAILNVRSTLSLEHRKDFPKAIINLGTAASRVHEHGKIFQVSRFIQRDMNCVPLAPKYQTPFESGFRDIDLSTFTDRFEKTICGTGDSFVDSFDDDYQIADMEGYALASVCKRFKIPFISLKYISDSGDSDQWLASLDKASIALTHAAKILVRDLNKIF